MISRRTLGFAGRAAALAPLLMMIVSLPGELMMRCRMDGLLRPACCCPQDDAAPSDGGPVARQADCCAPEMSARHRAPVDRRAAPDPVTPRPTAIAALALAPPAAPRFVAAFGAAEPARDGPPLVLLKHAFLI